MKKTLRGRSVQNLWIEKRVLKIQSLICEAEEGKEKIETIKIELAVMRTYVVWLEQFRRNFDLNKG
jgi:hypothetical protein